jgi:hypothetical protein
MKHIAIALTLLATLAIEARAQEHEAGTLDDYAGEPDAHGGLGIARTISAGVRPGRAPYAWSSMWLRPNVLGRSLGEVDLDVEADAFRSGSLTLSLAGVLVEDEAGSHIDVDVPNARAETGDCFLAIVGRRLVSFAITVTAEMDLDLEVTARLKIIAIDRWGRIVGTAPPLARIDGTAHGIVHGSVRVHTRGVYAFYGLKFFDGILSIYNLAAYWGVDAAAVIEIDPVSMYIRFVAPPYNQLHVRALAPKEYEWLVHLEPPM